MNFFYKKYKIQGFSLVEMIIVLLLISVLSVTFLRTGYRKDLIRNYLFTDTENVSGLLNNLRNKNNSYLENNIKDISGYGIYVDINNSSKVESFYKFSKSDFNKNDIVVDRQKPIQDLILSNGDYISKICLNDCNTKSVSQIAVFLNKSKDYFNFSYFNEDKFDYFSSIEEKGISSVCVEISSQDKLEIRHIDIYYIGQTSASYGPCL